MSPITRILAMVACLIFALPGTGASVRGEYRNPTPGEFPIMGWNTFKYPGNITLANFKTFRDAGFNISMSLRMDVPLTAQSARLAGEAGVRVMANCKEFLNTKTIPGAIASLKQFDNIIGYTLGDEPYPKDFGKYVPLVNAIEKADPGKMPFLNLLPMYGDGLSSEKAYNSYLDSFINTFNLPLLSYDNYPVMQEPGGVPYVRSDFFQNLELVSSAAKRHSKAFWAFCMSAKHLKYPAPTAAALTFEAFSALAYGAQGLTYYTYTLRVGEPTVYHDAPVDTAGRKTKTWFLVRDVNRQVQALRNVFLGCNVVLTMHSGNRIPAGCRGLAQNLLPRPLTEVRGNEHGVLFSHLTNAGRNYAVIVNHDINSPQTVRIRTAVKIKRIMPDGSEKDFEKGNLRIPPGGYLIFAWPGNGSD